MNNEIEIGDIVLENEIKIGEIVLDVRKVYPELENLEITPRAFEQKFNHPNSYGYDEITVNPIDIKLQNKEVNPTKEKQTVTSDSQYDGLREVTVNPIPNEYILPSGEIDITENGTIDITNYETANVKVPNYWTEPDIKDVNFIDYEGTLLYSYTLEEIQNMTKLPELPIHPGLTCQGWNWTLEELKELGREMEVGAMYVTTDGKTKAHIHLYSPITGTIIYTQTVANSVVVNWGDGSPTEISDIVGAVTLSHDYTSAGNYVITLDSESPYDLGNSVSTSNNFNFMGSTGNTNKRWTTSLIKVYLGKNVRALAYASFREVYSLKEISISEGTDLSQGNTFYSSNSLTGCVFPRSNYDIGGYMFQMAGAMRFISLPPNLNTFSNFMGKCDALKRLNIPNITGNLSTLGGVGINIEKIYIPDSMEPGRYSSGYNRGFANNQFLKELRLPEGWKTLSTSFVANDNALEKLEFPSTVNNISSSAFNPTYGLKIIDFSKCTEVPTLQNINAFNNCFAEIWIPASLYDEWITATNWANVKNTFVAK